MTPFEIGQARQKISQRQVLSMVIPVLNVNRRVTAAPCCTDQPLEGPKIQARRYYLSVPINVARISLRSSLPVAL
jgi:hypothetical protein